MTDPIPFDKPKFLNKPIVKKLYKQGLKISEIARRFNVSSQRIHQIVKNYTSFRNHNFSFANYPNLKILQGCRGCGAIVEDIHYKNFNSNNNNEDNLEPLCKKCHKIKHKWVSGHADIGEKSIRVRNLQKRFKKLYKGN